MPGFDKTGPAGMGPGTGMRRGQCVDQGGSRRGLGRGYGCGRGNGRGIDCPQVAGREALQERINALAAELDSLREQLRK